LCLIYTKSCSEGVYLKFKKINIKIKLKLYFNLCTYLGKELKLNSYFIAKLSQNLKNAKLYLKQDF